MKKIIAKDWFNIIMFHVYDVFQEPGLCRFLDEEYSKDSNGQLLSELQLLSNDIPTSPVSESSLLENDSDEDLAEGNNKIIILNICPINILIIPLSL